MDCYAKGNRHKYITKSQIETWCSSQADLESRALVALVYLTACRIGEASNLAPTDVIFNQDGSIEIHLITLKKKRTADDKRTINLWPQGNEKIIAPLLTFLKFNRKRSRLFCGKRACQYRIKNLTSHGAHCLRHSRNNYLASKGFGEYQLMGLNGWDSSETAKEYIKMSGVLTKESLKNV